MIVALDNTFLSLLLKPDVKAPLNPHTGQEVAQHKLKLEALIDKHATNRDTIVIPSPCYAEILCIVPDLKKANEIIQTSSSLEIRPFDTKAAFELALVNRAAAEAGNKKGQSQAGWNQIKFDRQIAATAKVNGAEIFYTDDKEQSNFATKMGMKVVSSWELELPNKYAQDSLL